MSDLFVTTTEGVKELRKAVDAWLAGNPENLERMPMKAFRSASGWDYSRTWQVARRWVIEAKTPKLIVDCSALIKGKDADQVDPILAKVVIDLHDGPTQASWGEINVRMGLSEGRVRKLYAKYSGKKDRGLRTGQGGRFVTDNPTLYLDNMKREGAEIAEDFKGIPTKPEQCLNYKKPVAKRVRKPRTPKAAA